MQAFQPMSIQLSNESCTAIGYGVCITIVLCLLNQVQGQATKNLKDKNIACNTCITLQCWGLILI